MSGIRVEGMDLAFRVIQKYGPKEIEKDARRASMAGARVASTLIRAETPKGKTKKLRRSVRAKPGREGFAAAVAGPRAPHRHLVIGGHRIVTRSGVDTGRTSKSNPFVDRAVDGGRLQIEEAYKRELFRT